MICTCPSGCSHCRQMTAQTSTLLSRLKSGKIEHLYSMGNFATPRHLDYVCATGHFNAVWFDLEHFDIHNQDLAVLNMIARGYPITTIARFKASDYQTVMRVMETGAGGIMCSMVESAEEARQIVRWAKFLNPSPSPGEVTGLRGWNGGGVDARYGTVPSAEYVRQQNNEVAIICQIETPEAIAHVDDIVSVPGVDGYFFGPGDYAHRIGQLGKTTHPEVIEAMKLLSASCKRHNKFWGTIGIGRDNYRQVRSLGAQLICPGGDMRIMNYGMRELIKAFAED